MKKLNNRGWGLITFLILISLLFLAILLAAYFANQYDQELTIVREIIGNI